MRFELHTQAAPGQVLHALTDFSEKYQTSWDEKNPLFRRVKRETVQTAD